MPRGNGLRRDAPSRTIADLIARELALYSESKGDVDTIVGLKSDYQWDGEDIIETLRRRPMYLINVNVFLEVLYKGGR